MDPIRELRFAKKVSIMSKDVVMKGEVSPLYIAQHIRLPNHYVVTCVICLDGYVPNPRESGLSYH